MSAAGFVATKFGREPEQRICDEDCAEFLSGARFDIPFPPKQPDSATLRQMHDALQQAWIIFDSLHTYYGQEELLKTLRSRRFWATRDAVREAAALRIGRNA